MLKVFLVEDEIIMREGIKKNIPWEEEGFEFVGDASDGELAYPLIMEKKPDILITDIKMPFMDGLELSRLVKADLPKTKIIVLSGYNEFEYAKQALQIGVTDYLLKPITGAQLVEELHRIEKKIESDRERLAEGGIITEIPQEEILARQSFLRKLVIGKSTLGDLITEGQNLGLELNARCYNLLMMRFYSVKEGVTVPDCHMIEKVWDLQKRYMNIFMVIQGQEELALIFKGESKFELQKLYEGFASDLDVLMDQQEEICYFGIVGDGVSRLRNIQYLYADMQQMLMKEYRKHDNQFLICLHHDASAETITIKNEEVDLNDLNVSQKDRKLIEGFIITGSEDEIDGFLDDYFKKVGGNNIQSILIRQYVAMDMFIIIRSALLELGYDKKEIAARLEGEKGPAQLFDSIESMKSYLKHIFTAAIQLREESRGGKYASVIKNAKNYIGDHFNEEDISLNTVADMVGMSPNHFSSVFSQEEGKTFTEYLTEVRMEEAKKLLRTTQLRTTDIAFAVGYHDSHYFSSIFKKTQNCTPREYRNKA